MKMKKKLLIGIIPVFVIGIFLYNKPISKIINVESKKYGTPANSAFQDENFYKCVVDSYNKENNTDIGYDTSLTDEQLATITELSCDGLLKNNDEKINNTNGIEKLINVKKLELINNIITSINLDENLVLEELYLSKNQIQEINLSKNKNLIKLGLSENQLTNIDLSKNENLKFIGLNRNQLTEIDLNKNTKLTALDIYENSLTKIDLDLNTHLTYLNVHDNQLTEIDLKFHPELQSLILTGNDLTEIDLSINTNLTRLDLDRNKLTEINLNANTNLESLALDQNQLTNINLSNNTALKTLSLNNNQLTSINLNTNTNLEELYLENNQLPSINISDNIALKTLNLNNNELTNININSNTNLQRIYLENNQLTNINLSNNTALKTLILNDNHLASINLNTNTNLEELQLANNQLTNIDLTNNVDIKTLNLRNNQLTSLDLTPNIALTKIDISNNNFGIEEHATYKNETYNFNNESKLVKIPNNNYLLDNYNVIDNNGEIQENVNPFSNLETYLILANYYQEIEGYDEPNTYTIKYKIHTIEATSNKYYIDSQNNFIYTETDTDPNTIVSNIQLSNEIVSGEIIDDKYVIKYNDEIVKSFDIVNISSDKYDLTKEYLAGDIDDIINNINYNNQILSIKLNIVENKIEIKNNNKVLQSFHYINFKSNKYDLTGTDIYIDETDISNILNNINCTGCNAYIFDGTEYLTTGNISDNQTLRIMYSSSIVKEFNLKYRTGNITLNKNNLKLNLSDKKTYNLSVIITPETAENIIWESSNPEVATVDENGLVTAKALGETTITVKTENGEFTDTCDVLVTDTVTYKATFKDGENTYTSEFEENEDIVFKTDLEKTGYELVGWKYNNQNYSLTDKLTMPGNDIELDAVWELVIPELNNYESDDNNITGISIKTNVDNLNLGIDSIYEVKVSKPDGTDKTSGLVGTGDKVKIYLDNQLVSEYDVIIKGDVTGTGTSTVSDVAKLYQFLKGKIQMDECYKKAGNVVGNDNEIKINDVAKLYQFIKGKIDSL